MSFFDDNPHSAEDAIMFYAQVTLPENKRDAYHEKTAADMSFVIPSLMGLGAAGTAGYLGMREAKSQGRMAALRDIKDERKRKLAIEQTDRDSLMRAAPAAGLAGGATAYLLGSHVPEEYVRETLKDGGTVARKSLSEAGLRKQITHGPGAMVQRGLKRLGGTTQFGRALAATAGIGAGLYTGSRMGKRRYKEDKSKSMKKQAGLFMRPSDVAGDHRDLSAALEEQLNGAPGQKGHFKKAAVSRKTSVAAGAVIGGTYETIRREATKPVDPPPVEEVKGFGPKLRRKIHKARYKGDQFARRHPAHATMIAMAAGGAAGAATGFGGGVDALNKTRKGRV